MQFLSNPTAGSGVTFPGGGGGTPAVVGVATLNFGAYPGTNEASVAVTGQSGILSTSTAQAFVKADDTTADHTANDHAYLPMLIGLACNTPTDATGFTIYARSQHKLQGTFKVRWIWQ